MRSLTIAPDTVLHRIANGSDYASQFHYGRSGQSVTDLKNRLARAIDRKLPLLGDEDIDVMAALINYIEAL